MSNCESKVACVWPNCECDQDEAPKDVQFLESDEDYFDELEDGPELEPNAESTSRSIDRENAREINRRRDQR